MANAKHSANQTSKPTQGYSPRHAATKPARHKAIQSKHKI